MKLKFETPVPIIVGLGHPASVDGVMTAYAVLDNWPVWRRDRLHSLAIKACRAALAHEVEPETARTAFLAFAHRHDILANDDATPAITASACEGGSATTP